MKTTLALSLCAALVVVHAAEKYTTKFDNIDVDQILKNDRLLTPYMNCILKDTNCTPDARELKRVLPDALATNCSKCSEKQKAGAQKVISYLAKNKPDVWNEVLAKYDKNNVYRTKYADEARKLGVPI
ncbi:PREDICTED: ejaculatory bulb-specific protein 3-like [Ceratosolen solmsi marchali]|uniref:Ejaculatory bulb-specific protein 3-like n=1 Tax=Ceratosolen solmsi marchali TaxID=326594 RepID=A0AAJ6YTV3_9HYME|nr:PREDICTED: ejaculatory bulb-specific protein 3-like [Ceratosolen solmsi marchali]